MAKTYKLIIPKNVTVSKFYDCIFKGYKSREEAVAALERMKENLNTKGDK